MDSVKSYLEQARKQNHQEVMSANGERSRYFGADGWPNAPYYFTNDLNPGNFFRADGAPAGAGAPMAPEAESDPIVLLISNASAAAVSNFIIWQGNTFLGKLTGWNADGSYTENGVTIQNFAGDTTNVTWRTILQNSVSAPFTVGKMFLSSVSGSSAQIFTPLSLRTYAPSGASAQKPILQPLNPQQYQGGVYINPKPYRLDAYTGVSMYIYPSAVFQMWFYPSFDINLARGLDPAAAIGRSYANTPIQQPTVAIVKG